MLKEVFILFYFMLDVRKALHAINMKAIYRVVCFHSVARVAKHRQAVALLGLSSLGGRRNEVPNFWTGRTVPKANCYTMGVNNV